MLILTPSTLFSGRGPTPSDSGWLWSIDSGYPAATHVSQKSRGTLCISSLA